MDQELLYKNRSVSSCIFAAYKLMGENFKNIFRVTWLPVLLIGIFGSLFMLLNVQDERILSTAIAHPAIYLTLFAIFLIAMLACSVWASARFLSMLNERPVKQNLIRVLLLSLNTFAICLVIGLLITGAVFLLKRLLKCDIPTLLYDNWLVFMIAAIILLILLLPLTYISVRYLFDEKAHFWTNFLKNYARGFRHIGFLFLTFVIAGIITAVLGFIIYLPFSILVLAQSLSTFGVLQGDPSGMPGYILPLMGITYLVTVILLWYVSIYLFLVFIFMYGSIERQRSDRHAIPLAPADFMNYPTTDHDPANPIH